MRTEGVAASFQESWQLEKHVSAGDSHLFQDLVSIVFSKSGSKSPWTSKKDTPDIGARNNNRDTMQDAYPGEVAVHVLDGKPLAQQAALFSNASLVIQAHGAALGDAGSPHCSNQRICCVFNIEQYIVSKGSLPRPSEECLRDRILNYLRVCRTLLSFYFEG